jgi:succinate dehydrogenase hydrophobic anchor subunit
MRADWRSTLARDGHRVILSGLPIAMHCHHYNINLQKMLEDTMEEEGIRLMFRAAAIFPAAGSRGSWRRFMTALLDTMPSGNGNVK